MFGQPHRLRRIAAQWLCAWLLLLAVGIVNACVLVPGVRHGRAAAAQHEQVGAAAHAVMSQGHAAGMHDHGSPHRDMTACAKACNQASTGAQTVKPQIDPFTAIWLAPAPADSPVIEAAPRVASGSVAGHPPWRPAIPIRIAFLHLSL